MIFSGEESKKLWKYVNRLTKKKNFKNRKKFAWKVMIALYIMGGVTARNLKKKFDSSS